MDTNYIVKVMEEICNIPSPSGFTKEIFRFLENELTNFGVSTSYTNKGALIGIVNGKNKTIKKTIAAHADTLGAMVKEIKSNGRILITPVGGFSGNSIECENCIVHTCENSTFTATAYTTKPSVHVHSDCKSLERSFENMELVLDEKVFSKEDVEKLGINIGDYISFDPRFKYTEKGYIKSRHLDDKASVAIILGVCKYINDNCIIPSHSIQIFFSNYEEMGHGASFGVYDEVEEMLCVDMGALGTGQNTDEYTVSICAKDSSGPYDYDMRNKLVGLAKRENIGYKVDIYPFYSSDGSAALEAGRDIKVGLIGAGIYASHSYERTHIDSVLNTARLLLSYMQE